MGQRLLNVVDEPGAKPCLDPGRVLPTDTASRPRKRILAALHATRIFEVLLSSYYQRRSRRCGRSAVQKTVVTPAR